MKKILAVLFMLLVTVYFAATAIAAEEAKKEEKGKDKKGAFVTVELTGKILSEKDTKGREKHLFVAEDGQKYFIIKGKGKKAGIFAVADYANKTFKVKGTSKPVSEKDKDKKDYYPSLKIDEFSEVGTPAIPAEVKAPEAPATPATPAAEAPKAEVKAPEAPAVSATPAVPATPAVEAPKAEEKPAETGK
ncbi:MAG: hypothetical protein A2008_03325 [Candidatus Wallbacteria bacterium GWC2_49_35]|uniref:Uncharacterized protein n=1 Tax=Candidatus Wallbacteria bacterium GWC2_49_35 TaxID=1817813 RepID=A0A1F7WM39_9BACT|nr:MAG: hypothetical protein A2008_03325 [Candidatus Wallbacteria bacterium GWC2_49_35]HBC73505.1 hypothetical protein [Candidatus Wallbacteria bacterium]